MIRGPRSCEGSRGMVSSGRAEASEIGRDILAAGGNAVDAAVAAAFALGVCEPNASGIGGGGFMLIRDAQGNCSFIDFREKAPMAARPDMYTPAGPGMRNPAGPPDAPFDVRLRNIYGGMSVAVPGNVAGLLYALENYGTMSPPQVILPAARLARTGYVVSPMLHEDMLKHREQLARFSDTGKIYLDEGEPWPVGSIINNPDLAETLETIASGGADAFYKGEIARKIVDACAETEGIITLEDLANYRVRLLKPLRSTYRGVELISSPPPSSGGTHIIQILNLLENFEPAAFEINSTEYIHLFSEIFKICYADRTRYMGDPNFVDLPLEGLLSKDYARELASRINLGKSMEPAFGDPFKYQDSSGKNSSANDKSSLGRTKKYESPSTTHLSIADSEGNLVSLTQTINHFFGSCLVPPGTGFILNDQMDDFSIDPESANAAAGGKVPLSSMSPTFLLRDGKPFAVLGSPGGTRIISSVVQVISKLVDHGMDIESAIASPRFGDDDTNKIIYESRIFEETIEELEAMGHTVKAFPEWDRVMGAVNAVVYLPDGRLKGAADPRRDGLAMGI